VKQHIGGASDIFCFWQVNVTSYKIRPSAKDFIQIEILVERESQRSIILGKVKQLKQSSLCMLEFSMITNLMKLSLARNCRILRKLPFREMLNI
jgi:hypothetical protein